jgi:hypothetical protein
MGDIDIRPWIIGAIIVCALIFVCAIANVVPTTYSDSNYSQPYYVPVFSGGYSGGSSSHSSSSSRVTTSSTTVRSATATRTRTGSTAPLPVSQYNVRPSTIRMSRGHM